MIEKRRKERKQVLADQVQAMTHCNLRHVQDRAI